MKKRWIAAGVLAFCGAAFVGGKIAAVVMASKATGAHVANAGAQGSLPASAGMSTPVTFRRIEWDELVPKEWDPLKRFRALNLDKLNDSDPKAQQLLEDMRATWDNAPTVSAMEGAAVKLPGYIVPLEQGKGELKEFLLVPYFGACIHTPPPPANQIVHVTAFHPAKGFQAMDAVWVSGTMKRLRSDSGMGVSGYHMDAQIVERYAASRQQ